MAPKYIIDLLKANEPKRDNMQSNKAGLKLSSSITPLPLDPSTMQVPHYGIHS